MENIEKTILKEKKENIPIYEQIIFFIVFFIISLVISFFFLKYFVNMKEISKILFCFCCFYFTLFIFFQFIVSFDFAISLKKDIILPDQLDFTIAFIAIFYSIFNGFGYFLRYLFFPICNGILQSGYIKTKNKFLDALFYHIIFSIKEIYISHCILFYILIVIVLGLVVGIIVIIILYIDKIIEFYGNYGSIIINSFNFITLIDIYMNVGFFIIHNFIDCRRKCRKSIDNKYRDHCINLINEKLNKNIDKINKTYETLSKEITKTNLKLLEPNYYNKISLLINKAKENNEIYKINFNGKPKNNSSSIRIFKEEEEEKEDDKLNSLLSNDIYNKNEIKNEENNIIIVENNINGEENNINNEENNIIENENNLNNQENEGIENISNKNNIDNIEKEISPHIRKFKKYLRKIPKFQFLLEKIQNRNDQLTNCQKILLVVRYIIYYFIIIFILIFEYYCFKTKEVREKERKRRRLDESDDLKTDSIIEYILSIFLMFILIFITSFYTIAVIYSLYKRNFVTGDLLYGKHLGDNLNLINTTKTISGMATVLSYCNLYIFIYFLEKSPILYDVVKFPEYDIGYGYNFLGIIKFIFLITFGIIANSFKKIFCIKSNDFGNSWKYLC